MKNGVRELDAVDDGVKAWFDVKKTIRDGHESLKRVVNRYRKYKVVIKSGHEINNKIRVNKLDAVDNSAKT